MWVYHDLFFATRIQIDVSWSGSGSRSGPGQMIRIKPDPDPKHWPEIHFKKYNFNPWKNLQKNCLNYIKWNIYKSMIIVKSLQIFLNWFVGFEEDICEDNLFGLLSKYK